MLKNTIAKFKQAGLADKGEYSKASVRLELLEVKQGTMFILHVDFVI